uniref:IL-3 receptor alpha chain N-terminal domain-containing protein n=1 Tax=Equus caballus TaxID=9796 RepID=A0A9L0SFI1_HORSE
PGKDPSSEPQEEEGEGGGPRCPPRRLGSGARGWGPTDTEVIKNPDRIGAQSRFAFPARTLEGPPRPSRERERGPDTAARGRTLNARRSETEAHAEGCTARDPVEGKCPEPANPTTESGFVDGDGDGERLLRTRPPAGPMAFVWITLFLTPTSGLLRPDQDPSPPIRNVRMEPESQRLTWDLHGNVSGIECSQSLEYNVTARKNQYCQFPVLPSCGSKNYTVFVTGGQPFSTSIGYPEPGEGTTLLMVFLGRPSSESQNNHF